MDITDEGVEFAGNHCLVDFWGAQSLTSVAVIDHALRDAAVASRFVLLQIHLHQFSSNGGVTGVALLGGVPYQRAYLAGARFCGV